MAQLIIPDEVTQQAYTVVGAQTAFPFTFAVFTKADLHFSVAGVELPQSGFTLSGTALDGGGYQGGTVNLTVAVSGVACLLWRETSTTRTSNYSPSPSVPVRDIDVALNRLTAMAQDLKRDIGSLGGGPGVSGVSSVNGRNGAILLSASDVASGFGTLMASNLVGGTGTTLVTVAGVTTINGAAAAVSSVNGHVGVVALTAADLAGFGTSVGGTLVGGTNVTLSLSGGITTISATAGGGGVTTVNTRTGAVTLTAADVASGFGAAVGAALLGGANITVTVSAGVSTIAATGLLQASNNFSDVGSVSTARTNLGLGALAVLGTITASLISDPLNIKGVESLEFAISDEATALTTGTSVASWFPPYNFTVTEVFLGLGQAQSSSGVVTADMKQNGTTVFSTKPTVGASLNTSLTGTGSVPAVLSITALIKGDKMTADITAAGTGAKGAKLVVIGHRT